MPFTKHDPEHAAAAAVGQDQNRNSGRRGTLRRAASLPAIGRRDNPRLESLRSTKQIGEDDGYRPTRFTAAACGRKRGPSPFGTPQTDSTADASAAQPIAESEQRPRKRRKRSPGLPVSSSQPSAPSQSRRRTRSRAGSPLTDVECVRPSRISARLARKARPIINYYDPDIYTHLAHPDSAGCLLSEPSTGSIVHSTSKDTSRSQSVGKHRGRRRKTIDLGDEVTKRNLMEEWAQLRRSQGALPLSGIDQNACLSEIIRGTQNSASLSSVELQPTTKGNLHAPDLVESQATTVAGTSQSEEMTSNNSPLAPMDLGDSSPAVPDGSEHRLDHNDSALPVGETDTDQPMIPGKGVEASLMPVTDLRVDEVPPKDESIDGPEPVYRHDMSQLFGSSPSASRDALVPISQAKTSSTNDAPKDSHSQISSLDSGVIHLDFEEEFHMLDIPEMFSLPWVPVSSHLYVPPGLGKLISGMREQLAMATRARRKAEELYQAELSRRISAEKVIEELQIGLERRNDVTRRGTLGKQRASSAPCQRNF